MSLTEHPARSDQRIQRRQPMTHEVRWKEGDRWRYGRWHNLAHGTDGSLTVYEKDHQHDQRGARVRSLISDRVEVQRPGPRGGRRWVNATALPEV